MPDREELFAVTIGSPTRLDGPVVLAAPDPRWPAAFAREEERIRAALGDAALAVEHVGSTSVPGLLAKPIVDIALVVGDSADEAAYVPPLEAAGYALRIRSPQWEEHRMFKGADPEVNLHVFSPGSAEVERMTRFRDRLRTDRADLERYAAAKREMAARDWEYLQDYADAKAGVVEDILTRA
ncbi:MAG TPA: GrpB family protein [Solirubrobacteraceae bacterium]|nr:GrpB family protein [Solirubrobacteraceae bacterium]